MTSLTLKEFCHGHCQTGSYKWNPLDSPECSEMTVSEIELFLESQCETDEYLVIASEYTREFHVVRKSDVDEYDQEEFFEITP